MSSSLTLGYHPPYLNNEKLNEQLFPNENGSKKFDKYNIVITFLFIVMLVKHKIDYFTEILEFREREEETLFH